MDNRVVVENRISHRAYGPGSVLDTKENRSGRVIIQVKWDDPLLARWPGEEPRESF